jgi:aspartate/methionine/tyrosine aminotransferase
MKIPPFKLERYFARYEFSAPDILSASDCEPLRQDYLLSLADAESRKIWDNLTLGYTESTGLPRLREEITRLYGHITPGDVLVTVPEEGIFIAMNVLLSPGDHIICTFPGYQSLYQVAKSLGCRITRWQPDENTGWKFNLAFLKSQIGPRTRLLIVNFPHNPTGSLIDKSDFNELISLAEARGIYLFSDEMYRGLEYRQEDRLPAACNLYSRAISLAGMSKVYGLAGLRIGWLATRDRGLLRRLAAFKDYTTICGSAPSEVLALIGIQNKERIIAEQIQRILRNLKLLDQFITSHSDLFSWNSPRAGTIGLARLVPALSSAEFCRRTVEQAGIMLLPSPVFNFGDRHIRFGFGRESFPRVLEKFSGYLKRL